MKYLHISFLACTLLFGACSKFVETPMPVNELSSESVFQNDKLLVATLNGVYGTINNSTMGWMATPVYFSDDIINPNASGSALDAQENTYSPEIDYGFWRNHYTAIYNANGILEAMEHPAATLSPGIIKLVKGETLFLRAYCYFNLVNYYGKVPLVQSTAARETALLPQSPVADVYKAIMDDLETAAGLLDENYPGDYRWRVNKHAVNALLAKVYLYLENWEKAESLATSVINSPLYELETDPNKVFLAGSKETIWQLWNQNGFSSMSTIYVPSNTNNVTFRARPELLQAFEAGDQRRTVWLQEGTGTSASAFYPYKYKLRSTASGDNAEYYIQLRLADIFLVRAEARAHMNDLSGANNDLYEVRKRAGLLTEPAYGTTEDLVNAVFAERRIELMFENAERWFDLKRSGKAVDLLSAVKTGFDKRALLLPIPNTILASNPYLEQNEDY